MGLACAVGFGWWLVGCGGTEGLADPREADAAAVTIDPCAASRANTYQWIADFEEGYNGDQGFISLDKRAAGTLINSLTGNEVRRDDPNTVDGYKPSATPIPFQPRCGGRDGDIAYGVRLAATGLAGWGMNFGIDLRSQSEQDGVRFGGVRGTDWTGISFWARLGTGTTGRTALVTVLDKRTVDKSTTYSDLERNCDLVENGPDTTKCDPYGRTIGMERAWQFYAIPFEDLRQKGYGVPEPGLDVAGIYGFKMQLGKGDWDVWLDDIGLYKVAP